MNGWFVFRINDQNVAYFGQSSEDIRNAENFSDDIKFLGLATVKCNPKYGIQQLVGPKIDRYHGWDEDYI